MKRTKWLSNRMVALILSGMLVFGAVPVTVLASDTQSDTDQASEMEVGSVEDTSLEEVSTQESMAHKGDAVTAQEDEAITSYTVLLNANGGYFANEWDDAIGDYVEYAEEISRLIPVGGSITTFPIFTETDHYGQLIQTRVFAGWSMEKDGELVSVADEEYVPMENCVLYAVWHLDESMNVVESENVPQEDTDNQETEYYDEGTDQADDVQESENTEESEETEVEFEETQTKNETTDQQVVLPNRETQYSNGDDQENGDKPSDASVSEEETNPPLKGTKDAQGQTVSEEPVMGVVASGKCGENLTWTLDENGTFTVSGTGEMYNYSVFKSLQTRIPTERQDQGVPDFFKDGSYKKIKKIIIKEGVTSIGDGAFSYAGVSDIQNQDGYFTGISLPKSLKSIGRKAFWGTGCDEIVIDTGASITIESNAFDVSRFKKLTLGGIEATPIMPKTVQQVTLKEGVRTISQESFKYCKNLEVVSLPEGITSIESWAFGGCISLKSIGLPRTLKSIGQYAFSESGLENIDIPDSVDTIINEAFRGCKSLKSFRLSSSITDIGYGWFQDCDSLSKVTIPEGVKTIGVAAFYDCDMLNSINLPTSLTAIYSSAFGNCNSLKQINIPANVSEISLGAGGKLQVYSPFTDSLNLTTINVASANKNFKSYDGCLYNSNMSELIYCPEGKKDITIASTTTNINQFAFVTSKLVGHSDVDPKLNAIYFMTCSPSIPERAFQSITASAYYNNFLNNWSSDKRQNYGGTITWIEKSLNISDCNITVSPSSFTYDGTAKKPTAALTFSGKTLTNNTDYTVSYTNNTNAGTATITATGKGYFSGTISKTFTIRKASPTLSFANKSVSKKTTDGPFTNTLTKKTDGAVTFSSSNPSVATVNSSTGQVTIKGAGSVTITANAAAGTNYNTGSASYTLTVAQASKTFMVTYDANGGTGIPSPQVKQENVSLTLSSYKPTKYYVIYYNSNGGSVSPASKSINCTFKNWNTAKNGNGTSYVSGGNYTANADATLYAQWTDPKAGELATPTRSGYAFDGWYTASLGGNQITDSSTITTNMTIYAHWKDPYNLGDETYSFKNYKDFDSDGHCFGMSITSAGYYNHLIDIARIGGNANTPLYSFGESSIVKRPICYYQGKQGSFREYATVAGGSHYLHGVFDISSDWQEVVNYVRSHKYDNTGLLQIGIRIRKVNGGLGGHAVNFLRYERVNGQDRLYAYDNNSPNQETYFYRDTSGNVLQAPIQTTSGAIDCICLRDVRAYFSKVPDFDATHVVYMDKDAASIEGYSYTYMDTGFFGNDYIMYEIPANIDKVTIVPNKDYADFVYLDTEFSFDEITEATRGELRFSSLDDQEGGVDTSFIIYEENVANPTVTLSKTSFVYNGSVQKPEVIVKAGSAVLKESKDYSVEYPSGMINVGDYKVKVTLKGKYSGVLFATFNINKAAQPLTIKTTASSIAVGKTATVSTTGNKGKVTYTSSNTAIATVNASTGVVTGKKAGTVTITASTAATANYNAASKTIKITVTASKSLKKPGNCHFTKWNNSKYTSCRISWNKVDGAEGYETLLSWTNGSHASRTIVKSNVLYRDCTVHPQHVSQMMVRAFYMSGGKRVFGPWSNVEYITPSPTKLTTKNASSGSNLKMNINWNIIYGCNGYNVFLATNPNGTWYWNQSTSTKADATSAAITKYRGSKLKKNTRYYVRIVTRRQRNGVFCTVPMPASNTYIGSFIIK